MTASRSAAAGQPSFDDVEPPLSETTFVVVDLETTGGSSKTESITEIGAVKVRGGHVLGEFATLVNPGRAIPPHIVLLTGITTAMVTEAPPEDVVIPSFLEFARGCVLVAHNAPFDMGFLRAACARLQIPWPTSTVLDTVRLARTVFTRAELPSVRLGILAAALGARVTPNHRALADAQATVDVLHALIERLGSFGVTTLSDLVGAQRAVDPARRRKRHLADSIPSAPGVYLFRSAENTVLYVGTSTNLRSRVRSYFTAAETRGRVKEMVLRAERVDYVVCSSSLEAAVREQRLIAAHQPQYNRRSKHPERAYWLRVGPAPSYRLTVSRTRPTVSKPADPLSVGPDATGPFASQSAARQVIDAVRSVHGAGHLAQGRPHLVLRAMHRRMESLAVDGHFAAAAQVRDLLTSAIVEWGRLERLRALIGIGQIITASPASDGGWEIAIVRRGRLAAAGVARRGIDPMPVIDLLEASADAAPGSFDGAPTSSMEESATILAHLETTGVRIVRSTSGWSLPVDGVGRWHEFAAKATVASTLVDFAAR